MESIQDIEADETVKAEDWENIQTRLLEQVRTVRKGLEYCPVCRGVCTQEPEERGEEWAEAKRALESLESEIQQLGD